MKSTASLYAAFISWLRYLGMVILSGATVAGFILIFFDIAQYLFRSSDFTVQEVSVANNEWLDEQEIKARASIAPGSNIWMIDLDNIRASLLENPIIREVLVQRIPPSRIHLVVEERIPAVYAMNLKDGKLYGIGEDGVLLPPFSFSLNSQDHLEKNIKRLYECPIISGLNSFPFEPGYQITEKRYQIAVNFLKQLKTHSPIFYGEIVEVCWQDNGNLILHPRRRIGVVVLREEFNVSVAQKLAAFWNVLEEKNLRAIYVDARFPMKGFAVRWDESEGQGWKQLYKNGEAVLTSAMRKGS